MTVNAALENGTVGDAKVVEQTHAAGGKGCEGPFLPAPAEGDQARVSRDRKAPTGEGGKEIDGDGSDYPAGEVGERISHRVPPRSGQPTLRRLR